MSPELTQTRNQTFLEAEWRNLVLLNFRAPRKILEKYLPKNCEFDLFDGSPYLSLVAFQFLNTKVFGIKWPTFTNFPEVNLRFYIKYKGQRGVCFIREFVPSRLVSWVARTFYNEPYESAGMSSNLSETNDHFLCSYSLTKESAVASINLKLNKESYLPSETSTEHFFKEHELGVGRDRLGETISYQVWHPFWEVHQIEQLEYTAPWTTLYGSEFQFLQGKQADSVCFAKGSEVKVFNPDSQDRTANDNFE